MDADPNDPIQLARANPPLIRRTQQQCRALFSPQYTPENRSRFNTRGPPIYIATSHQHGGGNGLFSSAALPVEYYIAPYHGERRQNPIGYNERYMFEVWGNAKGTIFDPPIYIDGNSVNNSSCAVFLNHPNQGEQANVVARYHGNRRYGNLYIVTCQPIQAYSELLLDYNPQQDHT